MARPQKEGMDYFPHDTDASNDEKVEALRSIYGNDGYAFYFILLERIYRTPTFELDISDAEIGEETRQILARKIAISIEQFEKMLQTALKWGCFDRAIYEERGVLTSPGIKKRAGVVLEKREKMRTKYHSNKQEVSDAETRQNQNRNSSEMGEEMPQSKVKKSKEKHFSPESIEYILAAELQVFILGNNPKARKADLQKWAKAFDLMLRRDNRSVEEIRAVMKWSQQDDFWKSNVLSAGTLRDKFDTLYMKSQGGRGVSPTPKAAPEFNWSKMSEEERKAWIS